MSRNGSRAPSLWISLGLVGLVLLLYGQVLHHEFINLDDEAYIVANPHVARGLTWEGVGWAFTTSYKSNWHPLTWLSHMLDVELFGLDPGPHHMTSVLFHAANSVLLFLVLLSMTRATWPSALAAALHAVHPLRVESVAWAAERKDVLSGLFWMLTLLSYVAYTRRPGVARYSLVFLSLALGLMAKPMLVTLPLVLLVLDVWPLGRWPREKWRAGRLVLEKVPLLALSAASSVITVLSQKGGGSVMSFEEVPFVSRLANAPVACLGYLIQTIWPSGLAVVYPHPALVSHEEVGWVLGRAVVAGAILAAVTWWAIHSSRRRPHRAVGWLWYLITLVPVIGIVQVGVQAMADRYTYLPLVGIYVLASWEIEALVARWPRGRRVLVAVAAMVLLALCVVTWLQVGLWRDGEVLYEHALAVTTDNTLVHNNLGTALERRGKLAEAAAQYERALGIKPDYALGHYNLGVLLAKQGDLARARKEYEQALRLKPDHREAHNNLAAVLARQGDLAGAVNQYEAVIRIDPDFAPAYYNLGILQAGQGELRRAEASFERTLEIQPDHAEAWNNLGTVLERQGRLAEAAARYEAALRAKPDSFHACYNLGVVSAKLGTFARAAESFEHALKLQPQNGRAHGDLAGVLVQEGKLREAAVHYEQALRLDPSLEEVRRNLQKVRQALGESP